jgi:hypothetical protein
MRFDKNYTDRKLLETAQNVRGPWSRKGWSRVLVFGVL